MLWIKALHVLFVIAWLAGIFYLPRIFVHYAEGAAHGEDVRRLVVMARRLFAFMTIMAVLALAFGLTLWLAYHDDGAWLRVKLGFVGALLVYHGVCGWLLARLLRGERLPGALALRLLNESSLLLVVPIVLLAVVKPF
ncbi:MAG TPA: CopD family protein [Steroidobacteraceae bacterium]|nr:CopD family protein [Steroidobacteraceae bacterium]